MSHLMSTTPWKHEIHSLVTIPRNLSYAVVLTTGDIGTLIGCKVKDPKRGAEGGAGGEELAREVVDMIAKTEADFKPAYKTGQPFVDKIKELLSTKNEYRSLNHKQIAMYVGIGNNLDSVIEIKDAYFRYEKELPDVVKGFNLSVKKGEMIGLVGSSGCGKSTLINLIMRLYDADEGAVFVDGTDVREYSLKNLRSAVAVVLQKNTLFSGTVAENLRWGNENASDEELVRVCKLAQADEFINGFPDGYDTQVGSDKKSLSGGEKLPKPWLDFARELGITLPRGKAVLFGQTLYWAPEEMPQITRLKVLRPGLELGEVKKDRFEPAHALALWLKECKNEESFGASGPEMANYLHGDVIPSGKKGWCLVKADGYSIGWGKGDGTVLKNHYPKGLRRNS